ncbi:MAG: SDR family oxidoreductase [Gemmataceae bacterium]|nr:SDR family oxidoreductase [Gemmataceae bacterium]
MAVCLVTGGAGFIGSHLVDALLGEGHEVRVLDNFVTGSKANLARSRSSIELIEGDVIDLDLVQRATRGVDIVFHQAALASVPRSVADPIATHHACATGTLHVLAAAREAGVRRVVYAASSSAYGNKEELPKRETDPPQPLSPYAAAKLAGEHYCVAFTKVYGLETVRLRYFNIFGPRQSPHGPYAAVIPLFIEAMLAGRSPTIHGDGTQSRDFTFVADAVQANLLAATAPRAPGKLYNVACGQRTSLLRLVELLNQCLKTEIKPVHTKPRAGDVQHSQADIAAAMTDLGYRPRTSLEDGLGACLDYIRSQTRQQTQSTCH